MQGKMSDMTESHGFEARLLEQAMAAIIVTSPSGVITHWNRAAEAMYGYTAEEAIGSNVVDLMVGSTDTIDAEAIMADLRAGMPWQGEFEVRRKDGSFMVAHFVDSPVTSDTGELIAIVGVSTDVTQRRRMEHRLELQYAVTRVLADSETLDEAQPHLLRALGESLGFDFAEWWEPSPSSGALVCVELWAADPASTAVFAEASLAAEFLVGIGFPGRVITEGFPAWIYDVQTDENFQRHAEAKAAGLHTALAFPVLIYDRVIGVIAAFSADLLEADPQLTAFISLLGSQVGQFVQRTRAIQALRASEARKTAVVESALDCVITMDERGRIVEWNPAAERVFGRTRADVIGKEMAGLIIPNHLRDRHRGGIDRYLQTGRGPIIGKRIEVTAIRGDGEEFPIELAVTRVGVPGPAMFTGYLRDITDRKRAEGERTMLLERERASRAASEATSLRLERLQSITDAALSLLSLDELLDELLSRIAESLDVEVGLILLRSENEDYLSVRAARGLSAGARAGRIRVGRGVAGEVAATGRPVVMNEVASAELGIPGLRKLDVRSLLAVPLLIGGRTIGVLQVGTAEQRTFDDEDQLLLQLAADRIGPAIEHARLYEREHGIAAALQRSLLLHRLPDIPGVDIHARYMPGSAGVEVGGDWFDVFPLPKGQVGVVIGDVAGRGIRAATIMGQLRNSLRAYALDAAAPNDVLLRLNRLVDSMERMGMATVAYLVYDPESSDVRFAIAGHPPPLIRAADGSVTFVESEGGLPLGVSWDAQWGEQTLSLPVGSTLVLYTDGLIERRGGDIEVGLGALRDAVESAPRAAEQLCDHVIEKLFGQSTTSDDVCLVALRPLLREEPLRIRLPAVPGSATAFRRALRRWLTAAGATNEEAFDVTVACGEAVSNAIEHAYGLGEGDIEIDARVDDGSVLVSVRDYGRWRSERENDRGRGFGMMRSLMDDVVITPASDGTEVRLRRRLSRSDSV